jgi:hypothetical protein
VRDELQGFKFSFRRMVFHRFGTAFKDMKNEATSIV